MRQIKFRLWDGQFMCYTFFRITHDGLPETSHGPKKGTLMQFTGLLDKNGKEIYEGDIVTWWDGPNESDWNPRLAIVEFSPELAFYALNVKDYSNTGKYGTKEGYGHKFGFSNFIYTDTEEHIQVIGNIYENPELLK